MKILPDSYSKHYTTYEHTGISGGRSWTSEAKSLSSV